MRQKDNILEIRNLSKTYKTGKQSPTSVKRCSFSLAKGELLVIMGRSGSGKTTILNLLRAMDAPDKGSISINGLYMDDFLLSQM